MARVTVEDCVVKAPNRFELVLLASHRAREISAGAPLTVERDRDKNPVVALREIAEETQGVEELRDELVRSMQKHVEVDEAEDDDLAALMAPDAETPEVDGLTEEQLLRALRGEIGATPAPREGEDGSEPNPVIEGL